MLFYFLFIYIAAWLGHSKARALVRGQKDTLSLLPQLTEGFGPQRPIWIHAASVGEFEQARPLIEKIRLEQPQQKIILTFFSPSGYELRKNYNQVDGVYYLPFATRRNARRFLDALQPRMAIFVKYEFWPAYLRELKKRQIPTYSISAIFRPGQLFFLPWGKAHLALLRCFTHIYVQDNESKELLVRHGIDHCSVAGDTRFDRVKTVCSDRPAANDERLRPIVHFAEGCERIIVAGSSWPKDETLLAQYIQRQALYDQQPAKLILVPHEIDEEHLHFIFKLFQGRIVRYSILMRLGDTPACAYIARNAQILVVDQIGLLSKIYTFGHVAYIGGGFGVGIHNTIEAAVYGMPVIFGPNYMHFREAKGLIAAGAARSIKNYDELAQALALALDQHNEIGAKAAAYVASELGTTERIYHALFDN